MSEFKVGCSPLTSQIFAGTVTKTGLWGKKKYNVTETAVGAVAQHLMQLEEELRFDLNGKKYALRVVELKSKKPESKTFSEEDIKKAFEAGSKNIYECESNSTDKKCYCKNDDDCQHRYYINSEDYLQKLK